MNLNIAVVGCGYWGKNLVRVFSELGVLRCVCDKDVSRQGGLVFQGPSPVFTEDLAEVLADPTIQAVAVATPAVTHYGIVKSCLEAGKDV
jgi:UDP-2-acetamido-3-amino-2,3-dideoxy-glucuronate N-acetyltransferase